MPKQNHFIVKNGEKSEWLKKKTVFKKFKRKTRNAAKKIEILEKKI